MIRTLFLVGLLGVVCGACSSSDDDKANCPDVGGDWHVTQHCDASLIDEHMTVLAYFRSAIQWLYRHRECRWRHQRKWPPELRRRRFGE